MISSMKVLGIIMSQTVKNILRLKFCNFPHFVVLWYEQLLYIDADFIELINHLITHISQSSKHIYLIIHFSIHSDIEALHMFRDKVSVIQRDAVWWLHTVLPKFMEIKPAEYVHW